MEYSLLNTLFVQTRGATLRRDHLTVSVVLNKAVVMTVPIHQIEAIVVWGGVHVTPALMALCAANRVAVNYMTDSGRFLARVASPAMGNVLLRRQQFRVADDPGGQVDLVRSIVAGKIRNCRGLLVRCAREQSSNDSQDALLSAADRMESNLKALPAAATVDSARGHEGDAAQAYFGAFNHMIKDKTGFFRLDGRTRRPPLDPVNSLLSFAYGMLLQDCSSAVANAGLDPEVGFLHCDRPGRPGLSLDLMEEFRALAADRFVLSLINRGQLDKSHFDIQSTGAVLLRESGRRIVIKGWHDRKKEIITHPLVERKMPFGLVPSIQARVLARRIRGEIPSYVPYVPRN